VFAGAANGILPENSECSGIFCAATSLFRHFSKRLGLAGAARLARVVAKHPAVLGALPDLLAALHSRP
jgi:hypothetical protein